MTDDTKPPQEEPSEKKDTESKGDAAARDALDKLPPEQVQALINKLPPEQVQHALSEFFFAVIEKGSGTPKIDPEVFKIAAATVEKDNENKFKYLTQKEENAAAKSVRDHEFRLIEHKSRFSLLRPIVLILTGVVPVCLFIGIYLAATGHETLGTGILTTVITAVLAYIAGQHGPDWLNFQSKDKRNGS